MRISLKYLITSGFTLQNCPGPNEMRWNLWLSRKSRFIAIDPWIFNCYNSRIYWIGNALTKVPLTFTILSLVVLLVFNCLSADPFASRTSTYFIEFRSIDNILDSATTKSWTLAKKHVFRSYMLDLKALKCVHYYRLGFWSSSGAAAKMIAY